MASKNVVRSQWFVFITMGQGGGRMRLMDFGALEETVNGSFYSIQTKLLTCEFPFFLPLVPA